jgi:hypothetical protein
MNVVFHSSFCFDDNVKSGFRKYKPIREELVYDKPWILPTLLRNFMDVVLELRTAVWRRVSFLFCILPRNCGK